MSCSRLLILLLLLIIVPCPSFAFGRKVGGRSVVPDVRSNREVQDLGRFSVEEYNRRAHIRLQQQQQQQQQGGGEDGGGSRRLLSFSRVVAAERQVVSGIKYYLQVEAAEHSSSSGSRMRTFEAVVVVKAWAAEEKERRDLLSFMPAVGYC